jgi:nucleoid-associated protein YgaU
VGWPPQPAQASAGWPTRAWNSSESALNWVGNKVLGTASPAVPTTGSKTYLVKPLETWETLAQRFYGDPRHATTLQGANQQVPAGSKIRPGTVINVPAMPL